MNFRQPQRQQLSSPTNEPHRRRPNGDGNGRGRSNGRGHPGVDDDNARYGSRDDGPPGRQHHVPAHMNEQKAVNNHATNTMKTDRCRDPPVIDYDSPEDDSAHDSGSTSSESSQRRRRRQLRELAAQSEDCWAANLSDDESAEALPLEWNSSMVRRQMMRRSGVGRSGGEAREVDVRNRAGVAGSQSSLDIFPQQTLATTNFNEARNDSRSSIESEGMSLPEQLLHKRLMRKERLHKRYEQNVRYQHHQHHQQRGDKDGGTKSASQKIEGTANTRLSPDRSPARNHLSGKNSSELRASSPLFPDEEFDVDNVSTVASSNLASTEYCHLRSSALHMSREQNESLDDSAAADASSPLRSLPHRPICPFPEEADRKRIVGCLAAVLASSYPYETAPHLLIKEEKMGKGISIVEDVAEKKNRFSDQDSPMTSDNKDAAQLNMTWTEESTEGSTFAQDRNKNREFDGVDSHCDPSTWKSTHGTAAHPHLQQHERQQHLIQQSRKSQRRQRSRSPIRSFSSFTAAFQKNNTPSFKNRSHSSGDLGAAKKPTPSNPMASLQHSFSFASFQNNKNSAKRIFDSPGSQNPPPSLTTELAEIRHRIRRHAVLSELLLSAAEMLVLDPRHAKAFLPMLEGLLTKVDMPETNNDTEVGNANPASRQSWKGRGFGGGGVPHPNFCDPKNSASSVQLASPNIHGSPPLPSTLSSDGPQNGTGLMSISEKDTHKRGDASSKPRKVVPSSEAEKNCHLYEMHPSSSRSQSSANKKQQCVCTGTLNPSYAPLETAIVEKDLVAPFLQTLTPGAGFRCIALLLLNHLLRDGRGYDSRVRQVFKRLAVIVISHELKVGGILRADLDDEEGLDELLWGEDELSQQNPSCPEEEFVDDADELARLATRKFEAMEHAIAAKLISMSRGDNARSSKDLSPRNDNVGTRQQPSASRSSDSRLKQSSQAKKSSALGGASSPSSSRHGRIALAPKETPFSSQHGISKEQILRGIKVGTAGAVGATLFALTGGLAAPGIAAGLAAVAGTSAIAAGVSTVLSSAAAISTIFGVGGAGLASYKMHRRTKGLTEFNFHKEAVAGKDTDAELFSTVCISGWLRDARDFQRPWGVLPSHPRIIDKQELLERFYFIHNPVNVFRVGEILKHWKGRYFQLWRALREKYGSDPSNLFPLDEGPRISAELTHEEGEAVDILLDELGYFPKQKILKKSSFFGRGSDVVEEKPPTKLRSSPPAETKKLQSAQKQLKDSSMRPKKWLPDSFSVNGPDIASPLSLFSESETKSVNDNSIHTIGSLPSASNKGSKLPTDLANSPPPKHLLTVWDYHANYGGELYTVQWESELLMELCDSVTDQMIEWGISATKTILHTTVFATLMTAVTLPYSLVLAANAIDSSWTMAMERADRAGVELAKSLIESTAGHRPVILAGFSMGARVIYSCLKELARHQEIWEDHQQKKKLPVARTKNNAKGEDKEDDKLKYIREPASIVEDAILMGTPNHVSLKSWEACRRIVAGRVINCYSRKDLILSLMFQMKRFQGILRPVCGTSPVAVNGVENYDVTDLVSAHTDYCLVCGEILKRVRHGQPQRASVSRMEVSAMVTTINVANKDIGGLASLSDETAVRKRDSSHHNM